MNYNIFKSRTFWTIVITIGIGALNAALPFMPDSVQTTVQGLLGLVAIYFHNETAKKADAVN